MDSKRAYNQLLQKSATESFKNSIETRDHRDVWEVSRRIVKKQRDSLPLTTLKFSDELESTSEMDTAEKILRHFYPPDTNTEGKHMSQQMIMYNESDRTQGDPQFKGSSKWINV